jgi:hypothetical protein
MITSILFFLTLIYLSNCNVITDDQINLATVCNIYFYKVHLFN